MLDDLCLPAVKLRWADLTDAGPGVGVSNYDVRFRDAELSRIHNSDYRVRCHRSRGDSGQGEAERANSAIADAVVDGVTLDWERVKRFDDLSKEQILKMSLPEFEKYERQHMAKNVWYVSEQISERIDDAPVLKEYIHSHLSETSEELFSFNKPYIDSYRDASEKTKDKVVVPAKSVIRTANCASGAL